MKRFKIIGGVLSLLIVALAMIKFGGSYAVGDTTPVPPVEHNQSEYTELQPEASGTNSGAQEEAQPEQSTPTAAINITADADDHPSEEASELDIDQEATTKSEESEDLLEVSTIQQQLTDLDNEGAFPNEQVSRALEMHLTAIAQFEKQGASSKVVKHMEGFMQLLDHQKEEGLLTEEAYQILKDRAQALVDQHQ